jgi:uncharacterized phage protein (TIGR01671 family)
MFAINKNTRDNLQKFRVWDFKLDKFHYFSLQDLMRNWMNGSKSHFKWGDIDLDNIQEFTGIMDSNRREVWEGDILEQLHPTTIRFQKFFWKNTEKIENDVSLYHYRGVVYTPTRICTNISLGDVDYGTYSEAGFKLSSLNSEEGKLQGCNIMAETKVIGNIYENIDLCEYTEEVSCCFVDKDRTHYHWDNLQNKQIQKYLKKYE